MPSSLFTLHSSLFSPQLLTRLSTMFLFMDSVQNLGERIFSKMGSYSVNLSSPIYCNELSTRIKCPSFSPQQHKGHQRQKRGSKVFAYYGLKRPPYHLDALEPYMSQQSLEIHWGKHHKSYLDALNQHLSKSDVLYGCTMDELVKVTYNYGNPFPEFNDAAQVWNHDFFWESMQPGGGDSPQLGLLQQIEKDFGSFPNFKEKFIEAAMTLFGSGWVWLVLKPTEKRLAVVKTSNAVTPIVWDDIPLLCLDMWEHAYYLDYQNDKAKYASAFMNHLVSWHAATARIARAQSFVNLGEPKIPVA